MNYETEPWYKLYIRESTEDKLLPVLNRALRDFLLRLAKSREDGTILNRSASPGEDIARAMGADASEASAIAAYVGTMLKDGFLSHRKGRVWITNFVDAQAARSAGARRQKVYRDKNKSSSNGASRDGNVDVRETQTGDVTVASLVTSQEIRSEKIRNEERRDQTSAREAPSVAVPCDSSDSVAEPEDPGRELSCPLDLREKLEKNGTIRQLAEKLAKPIDSVRDEIDRFVSYWTLGKGMGQKRTAWAGKARQWVIEQAGKPGGMRAPGAIEHDRRTGEYQPSAAAVAALGVGLVRGLR